MSSSDLREFTRVATAIPTTVAWAGGEIAGSTRDVSLNGVFVGHAASGGPPAAAIATVTLHLDGREGTVRIIGRGPVVRATGEGSAIAFAELEGVDSYGHLRTLILLNAPHPDQVQAELSSHLGLKRRSPDPSA